MKKIMLYLVLFLIIPSTLALSYNFVSVNPNQAYSYTPLRARIMLCQPIGVHKIVIYGRPNSYQAGAAYFNTGSIYVWNANTANIESVLIHEILEVQGKYGYKLVNHNPKLVVDNWKEIKCGGEIK